MLNTEILANALASCLQPILSILIGPEYTCCERQLTQDNLHLARLIVEKFGSEDTLISLD